MKNDVPEAAGVGLTKNTQASTDNERPRRATANARLTDSYTGRQRPA